MKKIILFIAFICLTTLAMAQAPCVPGTVSVPGSSYILPDSATNLNHGCAGMAYEQIIYLKVPKDTTITIASIPFTATVDSFVIDANVVGLPMGINVTSNPALLPPNPSSSKTNYTRLVIPGDSIACVKLSGILPASLMPGDINLTINIRAYLSNIPLQPNIDTPGVIDYYKITIDAPGTGACNPASTNNLSKKITDVNLSPNPVRDILKISMAVLDTDNYSFDLIGMTGRTHISKKEKIMKGRTYLPISVEHLADGIYFLNITNGYSTLSKKIVVQH